MDSPFAIILLVFLGLGTAVFLGMNKMAAGDVCDGVTYKATSAKGVKVIGGDEKREQMVKLNKKCFDEVKRPTASGGSPSVSTTSAPSYSSDHMSDDPTLKKRSLEPVDNLGGSGTARASSN